jgi:hypothetical protein
LEAVVDRDTAIRLDGMLMNVRASLDGIAHFMKSNLSDDEYSGLVTCIGRAMSATIDVSSHLHAQFPNIVPKELLPSTR